MVKAANTRERKKSAVSRPRKSGAITTYKSALGFLFSAVNYENINRYAYNEETFGLKRMRKLLSGLDDPHKKLETVHIAGSKGKGSVCTMLSEMLIANDYKVGLYTSPHILNLRERIQINGQMISEAAMVRMVKKIAPVVRQMSDDPPTFFELLTAISFMHFVKEKTDIAVIETGLGGRLDSTNVLSPLVVGITNISVDHHRQLGDTVAKIAKEKAGIFKKSVPAISVMQDSDVMSVLRNSANQSGSSLVFTGKDIDFTCRFESSRSLGPHNRICLTTATSRFEHLPVPLLGEHQAVNCGLALSLLDSLKSCGYDIDDQLAIKGLSNTKLPGRMEIIRDEPRILVDAAHNAASIHVLIQAIGQHIPYDSMVMVFGCCEDKDVEGMLRELQYGADKVIFTRVNSPRSVYPDVLAQRYTEICGKMCQTAANLKEAVRIASPAVSKGDLICITGSFYLVGEAKTLFEQQQEAVLA
ncbi:MAG: bifunctional folylpolyglutamate synthase/dihydrofolate synthase [Planctomycetes bacterium]|nr:bifunctional folylpolyglutamate synthase/dihydrofolate synthase [Planctomycetota bacterium]